MRDSSLIHYKHRTWMQLEHHCLSFQFLLECNKHHCLPFQVLLLILSIFPKKKSKKYILLQIPTPLFGKKLIKRWKEIQKNHQKSPQLPTTWKGAEDISTFIFWILPNLALHIFIWMFTTWATWQNWKLKHWNWGVARAPHCLTFYEKDRSLATHLSTLFCVPVQLHLSHKAVR